MSFEEDEHDVDKQYNVRWVCAPPPACWVSGVYSYVTNSFVCRKCGSFCSLQAVRLLTVLRPLELLWVADELMMNTGLSTWCRGQGDQPHKCR